MKILNLGDWHLGVKQDDPWCQNIQRDGIKQAIEYSLKNDIKTWVQYGDVFDVRKAITHATMEFAREIMTMVGDAGIHLHTLVGNHDMHYKNKIAPNAVSELLSQYDFVTVYDKPSTVDFDGLLMDIIPWMCDENTEAILNHIKTSPAQYCAGHWELNGFYFYKGMKSHGLEPDFLRKYKKVLSGHFHTISEAANVTYIGTPWTLTAGDENDPRGFWVLDTDTLDFSFVPNTTTWHRRINYPSAFNPEDFKGLAVRLIVTEVDNKLAKIESELEKHVHELRVVSKVDLGSDSIVEEVEVKSLMDSIKEYIDTLDVPESDKIEALKIAKQLYSEVE
ncbi:recombination endonuclease subunit [Pseudomonas phage PspYZU05]|uniref:Recombination endonuclease subunit n=1 Tax=Pseudomonas phage PspYZU05 TaxID=1983556 RepID=A0A2U7NRZ2_9CAUD|nr:recombination endonuclease subunit [Pseudomonas phage PspYZU05]ASD52042.1 recombination endonuclease subunit [Pseudomonas phage PspYZU05]